VVGVGYGVGVNNLVALFCMLSAFGVGMVTGYSGSGDIGAFM